MYLRSAVILLFVVCIFEVIFGFTSDELRITLPNGSKLLGRYLRSYSGRSIRSFTAIPYAKPPLGPLRFKAPEPLGKWEGEFKATLDGPMCSQRNPFMRRFQDDGTEDCLVLNVYTPYTPADIKTNLPVMVFFHGGGFMCGSGARFLYGPEHILDEDVILVTVNYRLGPLGFLSTLEENCPGNFGLKDQVMSLKWVQDNIKQFGGDPKSVTIVGGSAGGASVCYLMASPLAKGLFARAIGHSGTNLAPWSQPAHEGVPRKRAKDLAEKFDCYKPNDWSQTVECLRNVSAVDITRAFYDFFTFDTDPMVAFTPVVEPDLPGAFITKHPRELIAETSQHVPFLTGITYDEGLMKSAPLFDIPGLFDEFVEKIDFVLPQMFYYDHHDESVQKTMTYKIKEFYFDNNLSRAKDINVTNLIGDGWFGAAMDEYLRLRLANGAKTTNYVYLLTPKGSASYSVIYHGHPDKYYGVAHMDEALYLFPVREKRFSNTLPTDDEEKITKAMIKMWGNFARTGNPTPDSSEIPKWNKVSGFPTDYYRIGNLNFENQPLFGMERGLFEDRSEFWRELGAHLPAKNPKKDEL